MAPFTGAERVPAVSQRIDYSCMGPGRIQAKAHVQRRSPSVETTDFRVETVEKGLGAKTAERQAIVTRTEAVRRGAQL